MTPEEADELYRLIVRIFPQADAERAYRLRLRFLESGVIANTARELVFQHRETHEWLTEPTLLSELRRVQNPQVDASERMKAVARAAAERRAAEAAERKAADATWEKLKAWLTKQPPELVTELKDVALSKLPPAIQAAWRTKNPAESPALSAMIVTAFKERMGAKL